jgi:hypothetical protein
VVKQQGVTLVVVLGPLVGPTNLPRGILRIVVVGAVQCSPSGQARTDMSEEITEVAKFGMYKPLLLFSLEHVLVAVGFCPIAAT